MTKSQISLLLCVNEAALLDSFIHNIDMLSHQLHSFLVIHCTFDLHVTNQIQSETFHSL